MLLFSLSSLSMCGYVKGSHVCAQKITSLFLILLCDSTVEIGRTTIMLYYVWTQFFYSFIFFISSLGQHTVSNCHSNGERVVPFNLAQLLMILSPYFRQDTFTQINFFLVSRMNRVDSDDKNSVKEKITKKSWEKTQRKTRREKMRESGL